MTHAVLTSNSAEDILQIDSRQYWDHTHRPSSLNPGDLVYISPSHSLRKNVNVARRAVVKSIQKITSTNSWTSNKLGNTQVYRCRIELSDIKPVDTSFIDDLLTITNKKQNTSGIMYLDQNKRYSK